MKETVAFSNQKWTITSNRVEQRETEYTVKELGITGVEMDGLVFALADRVKLLQDNPRAGVATATATGTLSFDGFESLLNEYVNMPALFRGVPKMRLWTLVQEALEERKEPDQMSAADIHDWLLEHGWNSDTLREIPSRLLEDVAKLTGVQQQVVTGEMWKARASQMIPWDKGNLSRVVIIAYNMAGQQVKQLAYIERPADVPHQKTKETLVIELAKFYSWPDDMMNAMATVSDKSIRHQAQTAGISLAVEEES